MGSVRIEVDGVARPFGDDPISRVVNEVLDEVRPALISHGGDASLAGIEDGIVRIKLQGACHGCPMSAMTFGIMVDELIRDRLPDIKEVVYE